MFTVPPVMRRVASAVYLRYGERMNTSRDNTAAGYQVATEEQMGAAFAADQAQMRADGIRPDPVSAGYNSLAWPGIYDPDLEADTGPEIGLPPPPGPQRVSCGEAAVGRRPLSATRMLGVPPLASGRPGSNWPPPGPKPGARPAALRPAAEVVRRAAMTQEDVGVSRPRPTLPLVSPSSGWSDSNQRPPHPQCGALSMLRHSPVAADHPNGTG